MPDALPVALQLYSVREAAAADLRGVLRQVAEMGYDGVEFAGLHGHPAEAVRGWLDEAGLACPSTHTKIELLADEHLDQTVAQHHALGCGTALVPWLPPEKRNTLASCQATAAFFLELVEKLATHGLRTGFHVHGEDVLPLDPPAGDGRSPWEVFAALTPPEFILQYDTANGMQGGTDPVDTIRQHPGRSQLLHLKEFGDGTGKLRGMAGHGVATLGEGDVDLAGVLEAARDVGGTRWLIVEHEAHPALSELDTARACLAGLRAVMG